MPSKLLSWVRLLTAIAASLMACGFVHLYSAIFAQFIRANKPVFGLPRFVLVVSPFAYCVPTLLLFLGVWFLQKRGQNSLGLQCTISFAWLGTLGWILFSLIAWEVFRTGPEIYF